MVDTRLINDEGIINFIPVTSASPNSHKLLPAYLETTRIPETDNNIDCNANEIDFPPTASEFSPTGPES